MFSQQNIQLRTFSAVFSESFAERTSRSESKEPVSTEGDLHPHAYREHMHRLWILIYAEAKDIYNTGADNSERSEGISASNRNLTHSPSDEHSQVVLILAQRQYKCILKRTWTSCFSYCECVT
ncbi:unnamed protein product [Lasius platythorax]|uniref:Uncharacterized protein n=1 Tax=Lasius platythorax TaxID=488582 RepID=A0AAV2P0G9_9HYME